MAGQVSDLTLTLAADFALLYPPYNGALHPSGRAEGLSPSAFFPSPKNRGPRGLKEDYEAASEEQTGSDANRWLTVPELTVIRSTADSEQPTKRRM